MDKRKLYRINEVKQAKQVAVDYLKSFELDKAIEFGLPEIDDRYPHLESSSTFKK